MLETWILFFLGDSTPWLVFWFWGTETATVVGIVITQFCMYEGKIEELGWISKNDIEKEENTWQRLLGGKRKKLFMVVIFLPSLPDMSLPPYSNSLMGYALRGLTGLEGFIFHGPKGFVASTFVCLLIHIKFSMLSLRNLWKINLL